MAERPWLALLVFVPACALIAPPAPPPAGSPSADRLVAGPFAVASRDYTFVDPSRPSPADGAPRTLVTTVWFPVDAPGPHPLVLYSHGFLGNRFGGRYLGEYLASRGYVVAAPNHPFTRRWAPGGPRIEDVVNQPADLRLVIDRLLGWDASDRPFLGGIDPARIGVMGLSLGGMTATMIAFDPQRRDPRIAAAVSIAGPLALFGPSYFAGRPVPFLMIAGDADVVIDYAANAPLAVERVPGGALVSIAGASHVGFDDIATAIPRFFGDPDRFACWWLTLTLDVERNATLLAEFGETASGALLPAAMPLLCRTSAACRAMPAARQHAITTLAVGAFFDSRLSADSATRAQAARYLEHDIAHDFPEVGYTSAPPSRTVRESQEADMGCSPGSRGGSTPRAGRADRMGSHLRDRPRGLSAPRRRLPFEPAGPRETKAASAHPLRCQSRKDPFGAADQLATESIMACPLAHSTLIWLPIASAIRPVPAAITVSAIPYSARS